LSVPSPSGITQTRTKIEHCNFSRSEYQRKHERHLHKARPPTASTTHETKNMNNPTTKSTKQKHAVFASFGVDPPPPRSYLERRPRNSLVHVVKDQVHAWVGAPVGDIVLGLVVELKHPPNVEAVAVRFEWCVEGDEWKREGKEKS